ncbi:MAG: efflux RND transporter periplasmic adaptor subunit [Pseudomonadales bacterium]|nr:efflux RND transporter periplasmic adaptor subunit [Pseudomonadales bacterium]
MSISKPLKGPYLMLPLMFSLKLPIALPLVLLRRFVVIFFIFAGMAFGFNIQAASESTKPKRPPSVVKAVDVISESISDPIEALGSLKANESVDITVHFAEFIREIQFAEGQRVEQNDVLLVLENTEEQALLQEANFTLQEAKRQLARIKAIAGRGDASQSVLDERQREFNVAKARFAGIASRLKDYTVSAPFAGLIGLRNISQGAYVAPGDVITTLIDDSAMKLDFSVPAIFLSTLKAGMLLTATTRAFPDETFKGLVATLDNRVDPISRTVIVRALLPNPKGVLKPGLLMEVLLHANERQALLVPEEALVPKARKHFVMTVETNDDVTTVKQRQVSVGERLNGMVEIVSGLAEGETVVIHGADKVRDNSEVKIVHDIHQNPIGDK